MSDQSSAGVEQSGKSGGDAAARGSAGASSGAYAGTSQWGASGAEAGGYAAGGDVTDQTSIGSINVSS